MVELIGKMPGGGFSMRDAEESVCCLDPWMVLAHFRAEFGDSFSVEERDWSRKDYEHFTQVGATTAAETALRDAQRRGPMLSFRIADAESHGDGVIERYRIRIRLDTHPSELANRVLAVLKRLPAPGLQVSVE